MNARETMEALLDGKTLVTKLYKYKLNDEGDVVALGREGEWCRLASFINIPLLREEYHLTFKEAIQEMLNGKIVTCEAYPDIPHKFEDNRFFIKKDVMWKVAECIRDSDSTSKWKVVEE